MSSVAVQVMPAMTGFSKDSMIANKLASDLDAKLISSSKQVLLQRIEFKPATKPDQQYENLKKKYVPLNSQCFNSTPYTNGRSNKESLLRTPSRNENDDLPSPKVVLFPLEKVELTWKQIRRIGPGLSNLGNTCFLNSVLQVLTYTAPLVNYLATQDHSGKCRTVGFCMLCELQRHVLRTLTHQQGEAIKPMTIIQKLKFIAKHLRFGHQEDAHELLRYVIDGMQKSCLAADGYTEKLDRVSKQTTMVHQVFGGYYRSQVRCLKCKNNSNTFDPLMEVMLDIKHAMSVEKALQRFIKMELLDGENLYMCPRCKRKVPAHKQVLIHRAPNILTIQLKRFDYNQIFGAKVSKHIEYTEYLNLRPYMTSQGPPIKYRLYGVLLHSGYSCNSGHYYCYVRASNGTWYQMNDSSVRQASVKAALSQQAYLLFYTRLAKQESQPPSSSSTPTANLTSPKTMQSPRTPGTTKTHLPTIIRQNDNGTPVKSGIFFKQTPNSTSTVTKLNTGPATSQSTEPLVPTSERGKFTFTFPMKADTSKTKNEGNKSKDKDEKLEVKGKIGTPVKESPGHVVKSPVTTPDNKAKTFGKSDTVQTPPPSDSSLEKLPAEKDRDGSNVTLEKLPDEGFQLKKEDKGRSPSPTKKPRPPPLFIPRAVAQGKGTPQSATRATTPWKVTPKTTSEPQFGPMSPPPPGVVPPQPSPQSAMSDASSSSSMLGKTGEWTVSDKMILTPGPRLPERQHAGWRVTKRPEPEGELRENGDEEEEKIEANGLEESEEKERKRAKKKRKKEKKKKKDKKKYSRLSEEEDDVGKVKEKKDKKTKKTKKCLDVNEGKQESDIKDEVKKKHKRKRKDRNDDDDDEGNQANKRQGLVAYDESSTSSSEEQGHVTSPSQPITSTATASNKNSVTEKLISSLAPVVHDGEPRKEAMRRATWDGSRDSSTVNQLLSDRSGLHGYGSSVTSWEGGKNTINSTASEPDRKRRRRDSWDEDYDRGKEKKVKQKGRESREGYNDNNPFQREHDKKHKKGFRERFSRQGSRNHHPHSHFKSHSHSSRKYRRLSN